MPVSSSGKATETNTSTVALPPAICCELFGCNFALLLGGRTRYLPAGTQTLFAEAISAFAIVVEMFTLCSPARFRGIA